MEHVDPYGERVANCIVVPRPQGDVAQAQMITIEGGPAVLGSTEAERAQARKDYGPGGEKLFANEARVRRAHVTSFRIDRTQVTNVQYLEMVEACGAEAPNAESLTEAAWTAIAKKFSIKYTYAQIAHFFWDDHQIPDVRLNHPIVLVNHDDAGMYCAWRGARLPTEDEWERVARGREGRVYPWGPKADPFRANTGVRGPGDTLPVGSLGQGASPESILDLGGNVYEWTSTPWPSKSGSRVVKGNGWDGRAGYGRGAARIEMPADMRNINLGFRCAADLN